MLSHLNLKLGDLHLAEDCLQEAINQALVKWTDTNIPPKPIAWVLTTAKNKAIDVLRRNNRFAQKRELLTQDQWALEEQDSLADSIPDERLRLIFTCCHPALNTQAQLALTLKTLCGLSTLQIAHALLGKEPAIAQKIVRAKNKIKTAGIAYEVPEKVQWPQRFDSVIAVIYLIFNEGYRSASAPTSLDVNLCEEALYLGKMLAKLVPDEAEALGLLALMHFHYARFPARLNDEGMVMGLREQDRSKWTKANIAMADKLLKHAIFKCQLGSYQIQAAISGVHSHAACYEETDWQQIVLLYEKLIQYDASPVVQLNAAVALSFYQGPEAGLLQLQHLKQHKVFENYQPWYAAKADMLARLGDAEEAKVQYEQAISLLENSGDIKYLQQQLAKS